MQKISLVVPCFNEEENIEYFVKKVYETFSIPSFKYKFEIIAINDGSTDKTLEKLFQVQKQYSFVRIIDLSRNFGKESALSAGLQYADGDAVVPIDADLQHPPELILDMIKLWESGYEVVLAKRSNRQTDRAIQRFTANAFYKLHNKITHVEIPADVGDFRLMDKSVVSALNKMTENRRFMKGLFAWVGFRTTTLEYNVEPRIHGSSKFNSWRLWNFALEGITSFSDAPLKVWTYLGFTIAIPAFFYALYLIIKTVIFGADLAGYASIMVSVLFMGGVQLMSVGILGEYIGRIYIESKNRPSYIVRAIYTAEDKVC